MLDRSNASGRETSAIAHAFNLVDDRHMRITRAKEVGMQRMAVSFLDGAVGSNKRLTDHLTTEHALNMGIRAVATKQIHFESFQVQDFK